MKLGYVLVVECPFSYLDNSRKVLHSQWNTTKDLLTLSSSHSGTTLKTKFSMFPESKSMFLFRRNHRLEMFLFPSEIIGWCSSAQCSLAYDFTVALRMGSLDITMGFAWGPHWVLPETHEVLIWLKFDLGIWLSRVIPGYLTASHHAMPPTTVPCMALHCQTWQSATESPRLDFACLCMVTPVYHAYGTGNMMPTVWLPLAHLRPVDRQTDRQSLINVGRSPTGP